VCWLATACGRIAFDPLGDGTRDGAPNDMTNNGDGANGNEMTVPRACMSNPAYTTKAGLANRYREGIPLVTWAQARAACQADEADLWVVESTTEMNAWTGDWTGITDVANEGVWKKLDGTSATFLPWINGQPDGGNSENCVRTDQAGFEDRDCTDLRDYVCEC